MTSQKSKRTWLIALLALIGVMLGALVTGAALLSEANHPEVSTRKMAASVLDAAEASLRASLPADIHVSVVDLEEPCDDEFDQFVRVLRVENRSGDLVPPTELASSLTAAGWRPSERLQGYKSVVISLRNNIDGVDVDADLAGGALTGAIESNVLLIVPIDGDACDGQTGPY
jgi:hypothetical protein